MELLNKKRNNINCECTGKWNIKTIHENTSDYMIWVASAPTSKHKSCFLHVQMQNVPSARKKKTGTSPGDILCIGEGCE